MEKAFERGHPEIDVRWLDMGSQEVYDRLRSEQANPQADVWFGGPDTIFARGVRDGLLAPYRPAWADAVAPASRHAGDLYFGLYRTPAMLVYNSKAVSAAEAPRDWDDLLDPQWKGKILIRDPLASRNDARDLGLILAKLGARDRLARRRASPGSRGSTRRPRSTSSTRSCSTRSSSRQEGLVTIWDLPDMLLEREARLSPRVRLSRERHARDRRLRSGSSPASRHARGREGVHRIASAKSRCSASRREKAYRLPARTDLADGAAGVGARGRARDGRRRDRLAPARAATAPSGWRPGTARCAARARRRR